MQVSLLSLLPIQLSERVNEALWMPSAKFSMKTTALKTLRYDHSVCSTGFLQCYSSCASARADLLGDVGNLRRDGLPLRAERRLFRGALRL